MRSPMEIMVDKACGFNAEEARKKHDDLDENAKILLNVADAAKAWHLSKFDGKQDQSIIDDSEEKLNDAISKWIEIGG